MAGESQAVPRSAPDPSVLTTEQLLREIQNLTDLFDSKIRCVEELTTEKFASVTEQLALVERQRIEQKADVKTGVDAALSAQKEAVREQTAATDKAIAKTEASTSEQLRQLAANFRTEVAGVLVTLNDVKDRVVKIESVKLGGQEATTDRRMSQGAVLAVAGFGITVLLAVLAVAGFLIANGK